jgi:ferredoxin-thioredoxin reductase catalytic subunit
MRERHECHCMLFLTEDNAFAGDETVSEPIDCIAVTS